MERALNRGRLPLIIRLHIAELRQENTYIFHHRPCEFALVVLYAVLVLQSKAPADQLGLD